MKGLIDVGKTKMSLATLKETIKFNDMMDSMQTGTHTQAAADCLWECRMLDKHGLNKIHLSLEETQSLIDKVVVSFGFNGRSIPCSWDKKKSLHDGSDACTSYDPITEKIAIVFKEKDCTKDIVLHESAHVLMNLTGHSESNEHGPGFIRTECEVLYRFVEWDLDKLIASAKNSGLEVDKDLPIGIKFHGIPN